MVSNVRHGVLASRPAGMRDGYPDFAMRRRALESKLLDFFLNAGFDLVTSGVFEYVDTLLRAQAAGSVEDWVQWIDASGQVVALRPDMTPSIARMAAPLVAAGQNDIRWCYAERVYRRTGEPGLPSWTGAAGMEKNQVGLESMNPLGPGFRCSAACSLPASHCLDGRPADTDGCKSCHARACTVPDARRG